MSFSLVGGSDSGDETPKDSGTPELPSSEEDSSNAESLLELEVPLGMDAVIDVDTGVVTVSEPAVIGTGSSTDGADLQQSLDVQQISMASGSSSRTMEQQSSTNPVSSNADKEVESDGVNEADKDSEILETSGGSQKRSPKKKKASGKKNPSAAKKGPENIKGRKKVPVALYKNISQRSATAGRTGRSLQRQVREYAIRTGARAFFQSQYVGPNKTHTFSYGTYWNLEPTAVATITAADVGSVVSEAVTKSIGPLVRELGTRAKSPVPNTSTSGSLISPRKHQTAAEKPGHCIICNKKEVMKDFIIYESAWIGCTGDGNEGSCGKWVHADCIGFPGVNDDDVAGMPEYFCQSHMSNGRMIKRVGHKYASASGDEQESSLIPPPRKKPRATRGGRGRGK